MAAQHPTSRGDVTAAASEPRGGLLKILGVGFGVAVSMGAAIGAGILRAPATIAGEVPYAAAILGLWVLGGLQAMLSANIYAELSAAVPKSGGQNVLAHRIYGDLGRLVVGWAEWITCVAAVAATSVSFADFMPLIVPATAAHKGAVAAGLQIAIYAVNLLGLREGRAIQAVTSAVKAAMLLLFAVAAFLISTGSRHAVAAASPISEASAVIWTWGGFILAYKLVAAAYSGWITPIIFAGENVSPGRSIPRALFLGIGLTAVLYIAANAGLLFALGTAGIRASPLPFTTVLSGIGGAVPALLFAVTAAIAVASCSNANAMSSSRVLYALAEDGILPRSLRAVNSGGSPMLAFLMSGVVSLVLAATGRFALVFGLVATLNIANAVLIELGFFILRRREPQLARPYRALGYPWLPALALAIDAAILCFIASADHEGILVAIGLTLLCIPFAIVARTRRRR
ncbi:MAG TPA: APC family permease [Steroidobacteraceae bacterium]|jgi:APA family basic amino acid/polyamine antiporter|nr:APC family permease [Steroidobacteraceae bacterium]